MKFPTQLIPARLIKRYKRFLADIELPDGTLATAHCPNPGAMTGLADPDQRIWLEPNDDPKKKLKFGWRLSEVSNGDLVCIDTMNANKVIGDALVVHAIDEFSGCSSIEREKRYGENSRIDFLLTGPNDLVSYVEVKSVTLSRNDGVAEFPDTVSVRAAKHMAELSTVVQAGHRAVLIFLVQRGDCDRFQVAADIDAKYAAAVQDAQLAGVEILCFRSNITTDGITLGPRLWHNQTAGYIPAS